MNNIKECLKSGLDTITEKAGKRSLLGKFSISLKKQDELGSQRPCFKILFILVIFSDPYLASIYPVFSLCSFYTKPYVDGEEEVPRKIQFFVDVNFIPEGENDQVQVPY